MHYQELNLLVIFDAIMIEASITKAAERLNMTQPAVSNAVGRMRHVWKDELFVKDGRNILPTMYAERLWEGTRAQLADIRKVLAPSDFEPTQSDRVFKIAAIDSIVGVVWPQLRAIIEEEAPSISINTYPFEFSNAARILNDAKVEILITASHLMPQLAKSRSLCDLEYVTVMRSGHRLSEKQMTEGEYASAEHLLVAPSGNAEGPSDKALEELGLTRKIGLTVNGFSSVPNILTQSNLICTLPSIYVENSLITGELIAQKSPVKMPNTHIKMYWHERSQNDDGVAWLRDKLKHVVDLRMAQHQVHMDQFLVRQG